jgi:hypothetical protein
MLLNLSVNDEVVALLGSLHHHLCGASDLPHHLL